MCHLRPMLPFLMPWKARLLPRTLIPMLPDGTPTLPVSRLAAENNFLKARKMLHHTYLEVRLIFLEICSGIVYFTSVSRFSVESFSYLVHSYDIFWSWIWRIERSCDTYSIFSNSRDIVVQVIKKGYFTAVFFYLFTILNSHHSSLPITFVYFSYWPIAFLGEIE